MKRLQNLFTFIGLTFFLPFPMVCQCPSECRWLKCNQNIKSCLKIKDCGLAICWIDCQALGKDCLMEVANDIDPIGTEICVNKCQNCWSQCEFLRSSPGGGSAVVSCESSCMDDEINCMNVLVNRTYTTKVCNASCANISNLSKGLLEFDLITPRC